MCAKKIIALIVVFFARTIDAVTVGSNTSFSREANIIFPVDLRGNQIIGFASLEAGFSLINKNASCTYNGFEPITKIVRLNGGTLTLQKDLMLDNTIDIATVGTIMANGYTLFLGNQNQLFIPSGQAAASSFNFKTKATLGTTINTVDWSYDSQYLAIGLNSVSGSDLYWYAFNGATLTSLGGLDMSTTVNAVRWHPSLYRFAVGRNSATSTELRVYDFSTTTSAITLRSGIELGANVKSIAWTPSGNHLIATVEISGSTADRLRLYSVNSSGVLAEVTNFTVGTATVFSLNALSWDVTGQYCAVGLAKDATLAELQIYYFNGSTLVLNASVEMAEEVRAVAWHPTLNIIVLSLGGTTKQIRLYQHDSSKGTLTELSSARITGLLKVNSLSWSADGNYLLMGTDTGSGTQLGLYSFDSSSQKFTLLHQANSSQSVNEVSFAHNGSFVAWVDSNKELTIYEFNVAANDALVLNNAKIEMCGDSTFLKPVIIQGNCFINGNGATITLGDLATIQVASGATLQLKNLVLNNIGGTNLFCADSSGVITFDNASIRQCGDYEFRDGKIQFFGDVYVQGGYQFSYSSMQTSTINSYSCLHCDAGTTFNYAPSISSQTLLSLLDSTASLHLYETTLKTSAVGLRLTKGTIYVEGTCPVINSGASKTTGLIFGDGVSSSNDLNIKYLPESGLQLTSGYLVYSNVGG